MKNAVLALLALTLFACGGGKEGEVSVDMIHNNATASGEAAPDEAPLMTFDDVMYDFGTITAGEKVTHNYHFKNTGKSALIITSAKSSCGCTVPAWPKEPIPPGGEGDIKVEFDSSGKSGRQSKLITVVANTQPSTNTVRITGEVVGPKK